VAQYVVLAEFVAESYANRKFVVGDVLDDSDLRVAQLLRDGAPISAATIQALARATSAAYFSMTAIAPDADAVPGVADVASYGAVGDGVADDTSAIQAAIDALATTGGIVRLPAGTFKITSALRVAANSIRIVGVGIATRIKNTNAAGGHAFHIGSKPASALTLYGSIENLYIEGVAGGGEGIHLDTVGVYNFYGLQIIGTGSHGIGVFGTDVQLLAFQDVLISQMRAGKNGFNFDTTNQCNVIRFDRCTVSNGSSTTDGWFVKPLVGGTHNGWTFIGCTGQSCRHGMWLNSLVATLIEANYFEANSAGDIRVGTTGDANSDCRVMSVHSSIANGSSLGGYFMRVEFGARFSVIGLRSTNHAAAFQIVSTNEGGETFLLAAYEHSDTALYGAGTTEPTALPGPWKGAQGISGQVGGVVKTPRNLRGTATIVDPATNVAVVFPTAEDDAVYYVALAVVGGAGAPAVASRRVYVSAKAAAGFTINSEVAPGAGATVIVDWHLLR